MFRHCAVTPSVGGFSSFFVGWVERAPISGLPEIGLSRAIPISGGIATGVAMGIARTAREDMRAFTPVFAGYA
jgi:hypothetical protein